MLAECWFKTKLKHHILTKLASVFRDSFLNFLLHCQIKQQLTALERSGYSQCFSASFVKGNAKGRLFSSAAQLIFMLKKLKYEKLALQHIDKTLILW